MSTIKGLTAQEVLESRAMNGRNVIPHVAPPQFWDKFQENFDDPLIKILCVALATTMIMAYLGYADISEGFGIALSVFLATFVSTYAEYKNEDSFRALQEQASQASYQVFRDGALVAVHDVDVVVGDIILLKTGDKLPVDGVVHQGEFQCDESMLTGEAKPVRKGFRPGQDKLAMSEAQLKSRGFCFKGTVIVNGQGLLKATNVGTNTTYGQLAMELQSAGERTAPLRQKLEHLADLLAKIAYMGALLIAVSFLFKQTVLDHGFRWAEIIDYWSEWNVIFTDVLNSLMLALIIVVVAVPEGLPMMIAIVLSLNMRKLLSKQVLVRRLLGIETAGCMTLLLVDKTGTLTAGVFEPAQFLSGQCETWKRTSAIPTPLRRLVSLVVTGTTETVVADNTQGDTSKKYKVAGSNATDRALVEYLGREDHDCCLKVSPSHTLSRTSLQVKLKQPFTSSTKFSATSVTLDNKLHASFNGQVGSSVTLLKGAAEVIIKGCTHMYLQDGTVAVLDGKTKELLTIKMDECSFRGERMLALAISKQLLKRPASPRPEETAETKMLALEDEAVTVAVEEDAGTTVADLGPLILVGVVGVTDTLRATAAGAIATSKQAGIHVVMITGDRKETAFAVAQQVGLLDSAPSSSSQQQQLNSNPMSALADPEAQVGNIGRYGVVLTSTELQALSDAEIAELLPRLRVVARALPADKSRLVRIAQTTSNHVVGMTGDGVNDCAALKQADVSFAMGSGSEVAKEASDIVILDDNIHSILQAVLYGRTIFISIRKFIMFQSTINFASTAIVFVGPFLGFDFPLTMIQLLWLNLVMDTLAALAFGGEPALHTYITRKPVSRDAALISKDMLHSILVNGAFIAVTSICFLTLDPILEVFDRRTFHPLEPTSELAELRDLDVDEEGGVVFLTAFFCFFIFICTMNAFNVRTPGLNLCHAIGENFQFLAVISGIFVVQILFTEYGGQAVRTVPLTFSEWCFIFASSTLILPFDMMRKLTCSKGYVTSTNAANSDKVKHR